MSQHHVKLPPCSVEEIIAKCLSLGLTVRRAPTYEITHPAISLGPTLVTRNSFDRVSALQPTWNTLVDVASRDIDFLKLHLSQTAQSDTAFVGRLLQMLLDVYGENNAASNSKVFQKSMLGIFRTDYMRDPSSSNGQEWKNVEINTISCSFAGLSTKVAEVHQFFYQLHEMESPAISPQLSGIERSTSLDDVPRALAAAHNLFVSDVMQDATASNLRSVVVFVIQENERNTGDQYTLAFHLLEKFNIRSIRRTLTELHAGLVLHPASTSANHHGPLAVIEDTYTASVFYFRSCYVPSDFKSEDCWTVRRQMEESSSIKCPSIPYHLMTLKKIQQVLYAPEMLAKFIVDKKNADLLRETFVGQFSLNSEEVGADAVEQVVKHAVEHPEKYVLKPQLEGGGNLFANEQMVKLLLTTQSEDASTFNKVRNEYILMQKIPFAITSGALLRFGEVHVFENNLCCELGIFGTILSRGVGQEALNEAAGYVVRSKPADVADGGVMAGVAALDCVKII